MSRAALLELMRVRLGLDASSLGERVLDDACEDARRRLGETSDADLYQRVLVDGHAFAQCSECFVVPESWFFRTAEQFDDLVRFAREHVQRERRPLRVLSLPCAAGEEACSAVITLFEAGLRPEQIDVLGIDVSNLAVARAEAGVYRHNALRGTALLPIWMQKIEDGFKVMPAVSACTRFRQGNALDPLLLQGEDPFDVIFCRNLLIYLHPQARHRVIASLLAALQTPGMILAGQAEVLSAISDQLQPLEGGCPLSFVRRKSLPAGTGALPAAVSLSQLGKRRLASPHASDVAAEQVRATPLRAASVAATAGVATDVVETDGDRTASIGALRGSASNDAGNALSAAHRLADGGHTEQARESCLQWLRRHPSDVDAHYLLGLLESASGDIDAADRAFTRVLYLDRNHHDALQQRIGLAQRRGATEQVADLRARAKRLRSRNETSQ